MTQAIAGYSAIVKTSTSTGGAVTTIGELRDFSLNEELSTFDATSHDSSGERERIAGITGWTGTAEALYIDDDASQKNVRAVLVGRTKVDFEFAPVGSSSSAMWAGSGFFTSFDLSGPNEDAAAVGLSMEGSGVLTFTTSTG